MLWNEFEPINSSAFMQIDFITKSYENAVYVNHELMLADCVTAELTEPDMSRGIAEYGMVSIINIVERNLQNLVDTLPSPPMGFQPVRTWLGAGRDTPKLDFTDVNRWFTDLEILKRVPKMIEADALYPDAFYADNDRDNQHFDAIFTGGDE